MKVIELMFRRALIAALCLGLLASCGFRRKKYENPITKDTQQPDKVLFDKAVRDLERNRFEIARLTLQTLINTYDTSEYLAKAKLAIADSWFREGGSNGLAQAEAEYKDFILFYPTLEESAEAQEKVCMIPMAAFLLPRCDGTRTGAELLQWLIGEGMVRPDADARRFASALADLVSGGLLHVRGHEPPQPAIHPNPEAQ